MKLSRKEMQPRMFFLVSYIFIKINISNIARYIVIMYHHNSLLFLHPFKPEHPEWYGLLLDLWNIPHRSVGVKEII